VRWGFLACLVLQVAISTAFLVGVIVQTAVRRVAILKSSAAALMFALTAEDKATVERENPAASAAGDGLVAGSLNNVTGKFGPRPERGWVLSLGGSEG